MLIRKQDAPLAGEKLTVRVTFPPDLALRVREYSTAAGYGEDYPSLVSSAVEYIISHDPDFRDDDTPRRASSAPRGRRKKGAGIPPAPPAGPEPAAQPAVESAPLPAPETVPAEADPLPRRGLFGGLRS